MSVLVYIENTEGKLKKGTLEAASYAAALAAQNGSELIGVSVGEISNDELQKCGTYGVTTILKVSSANSLPQNIAAILADVAGQKNSTSIIMSNSWMGKSVGPRLAIKLSAGLVTEVVELPNGKNIKKKGFSGKAFVNVELVKSKNIIAVSPNAFGLKEKSVSVAISDFSSSASDTSLTHVSYNRDSSKLSLTDAELVVSAGRGLKGPENCGND
jgi:electron transfer flavoprotein alpha subunit